MSDPEHPGHLAPIRKEAIGWLVTMRGARAASARPAFEAWLASSPVHRDAYRWAQSHFERSAVLKRSTRFRDGRSAPDRRWLAVAAAVVALLGASLVHLAKSDSLPGLTQATGGQQAALRTPHAVIRAFKLTDGTVVTLNEGSGVDVAIGGGERRAILRAGQARFTVAAGPEPFIVEAGDGRIFAQHGIVDVGYGPSDEIDVVLRAGTADLRPRMILASYLTPPTALPPGGRLRYGVASFKPEPAPDDGIDRRDWPYGWQEYRSIRLAALLREAGRYAGTPIVAGDAATGDLAISGRFKLTDTAGFVSRISEVFDLTARSQDGRTVLRKKVAAAD